MAFKVTDDPRLMPAYAVAEAAHYLRMPEGTLRSWVLGRLYPVSGKARRSEPLIHLDDQRNHYLSFVNLVEAHVLAAIRRRHGVKLPKVRKALDYVNEQFRVEHPLISQDFQTDGLDLRELLEAANRRYLELLSAIEDPRAGRNKLDKLSQPVEQEGRRYAGFNLFDPGDETLLCSMLRGEFNISGLQNKSLRRHLHQLNSGQVSRLLKRLRTHGLLKKVGHTYKYYVTTFGKQVVATALKLRELVVIPHLAGAAS